MNFEFPFAELPGLMCRPALDMGLQDFRDTDQGSMLRVKGADTLLPIGPGIGRAFDLFEQTLRTRQAREPS